jgi:hypothetical protein
MDTKIMEKNDINFRNVFVKSLFSLKDNDEIDEDFYRYLMVLFKQDDERVRKCGNCFLKVIWNAYDISSSRPYEQNSVEDDSKEAAEAIENTFGSKLLVNSWMPFFDSFFTMVFGELEKTSVDSAHFGAHADEKVKIKVKIAKESGKGFSVSFWNRNSITGKLIHLD